MYYYLLSTKKPSKYFNNLKEFEQYLEENNINKPEILENGIIINGYFLFMDTWYTKYHTLDVNLKTNINNYHELSLNNWDLLIGIEDNKIVQIFKVIKRYGMQHYLKEIVITMEDGRNLKRARINKRKISLSKLYKLIKEEE